MGGDVSLYIFFFVWVIAVSIIGIKKQDILLATALGLVIALAALYVSIHVENYFQAKGKAQSVAQKKFTAFVDKGTTPEQTYMATKALRELQNRCPALFGEYSDDVSAINLSYMNLKPFTHTTTSSLGWPAKVTVEVVMINDPSDIPPKWNVFGQHLFYDMGGKPNPGISIGKWEAAVVCGFGEKNDTFVPDKALSFIH